MDYIFRILLMGLDVEEISSYSVNAFNENGEDYDTYLEWYKEINAFEVVCGLEVDVITDVINADFDEIIPTVDGILYFLNPMNSEETEYFEMILQIINSVKRNIPTIVIYNGKSGILPISANNLLEDLWVNHFNLEAFVNLPPQHFYQALQCLCIAMISGDTPLNIENAWMRYPIYIQLANIYFKKAKKTGKGEFSLFAAHAIRKVAMIADILNKEEHYIISEQAAYLYAQESQYVEASKLLQDVNRKKAKNYRILQFDSLILEGNKLFNSRRYEDAAKKYLEAAQWAGIELNDVDLTLKAFKLVINAYVSACKVEMAFNILNSLPHNEILALLEEIAEKTIEMVDYLVKEKKLTSAKSQLYHAIMKYQREGLFDILEKFTNKLSTVLEKILELQIKAKERFPAKQSYDEIENLWESYDVKRKDLDNLLEKLIKLFIDDNDFGMSYDLVNKIKSRSLQKKLTELISTREDKFKELKKNEIEKNLLKGLEIVEEFINEELRIIEEINTHVLTEVEDLIKLGKIKEAADRVKIQAEFLKRIGREEIQKQLIFETLNILLIGKYFEIFYENYEELDEFSKKEYLRRKFNAIFETLEDINAMGDFENDNINFERFIVLFREQELYEEPKKICLLYIEFIKKEIIKLFEATNDAISLNKINELIKKIEDISSAYLDKEDRKESDLDDINNKLVNRYIELDDLSSAHAFNDKIVNKSLKIENNDRIEKIEAEKRKEGIIIIEMTRLEQELEEVFSIIKNKGREYLPEKENDQRKRGALKRVYEKALEYLLKGEYEKAIEEYQKTVDRLIQRKDYNIVGISLVVNYLIHIKIGKSKEFDPILTKLREQLGSLVRLIFDTFPMTLLEYITDIEKLGNNLKFKESLLLFDYLPLFEKEKNLLNDILERDSQSSQKTKEDDDTKRLSIDNLKAQMHRISEEMQIERQDIAKRKLMKNQYWKLAIEDLKKQKFQVCIEEYIDTIPRLIDKKFHSFAGLSIILSSFIMVKFKNINLAKSFLTEKLNKYKTDYAEIENLLIIKLTKAIFNAIEKNYSELIYLGIQLLEEKVVLFDEELEFLNSFIETDIEDLKGTPLSLSREDIAKKQSRTIKLETNYASLRQLMNDIRREKPEKLRNRKIMVKRIYKDVLNDLKEENYKKAGISYFDLAMELSKRKDYETSSLLILIHGLCLIKAKESIELIRENVKKYLDSLGLSKKFVKDTSYYIKLITFILNVKLYQMEEYYNKIPPLLDVLPLLEEEEKIIADFSTF